METLNTHFPDLELIQPDIERDAPISLEWLEGEMGRNTLRLMGNSDEQNKPSTLEAEKERVKGFLESNDQLTWMIKFHEKIVGTVWVNLNANEYLPEPSIHIMIGDPTCRGLGIGLNTIQSVIEYLRTDDRFETLYSRHLVNNKIADSLLSTVGFEDLGKEYQDADGLAWQNEKLNLS
jgi:hypothetical protein